MSLATIITRTNQGLDAIAVKVEVHLNNGLPSFHLVGLPQTTVREAKERVRSAICNSGFKFPQRRITVNLAPADIPKQGGRFDLAIAIAILVASEQITEIKHNNLEFIGELALSGLLRGTPHILPSVLAAQSSNSTLVLPAANRGDAELIGYSKALMADSLHSVAEFLRGEANLIKPSRRQSGVQNASNYPDFKDVIGQQVAKFALTVAAAGGHNLLMCGSPGTGKTLMAHCLAGILPPLALPRAQEVAAIHSIADLERQPQQLLQAPFRSPHHNSSAAALIGGSSPPKPGEISLAHGGVLFLDELPEFPRRVLDCLREPLESGEVLISRARHKVTYPAQFQLIAAMNPSPCGHTGQHSRTTDDQIRRYLNRLSGPLLDRFDISVMVNNLPKGQLLEALKANQSQTSKEIAEQVASCRAHQVNRQGKLNAQLSNNELLDSTHVSNADLKFLEATMDQLQLSLRAFHRILRVARTIADLEQQPSISRQHIIQALSFRAIDKLMTDLIT
ncbi:YifB family Mg chelatase-like AAA ATPase [Paraferrimonas haliotis]|uniref:ATP-dependent protease n=1 Tax=Paraferrimonas haliotis TaxID=2013866 RepID=A0AA37TT42_9GAMM|nr:YifB family Mg chelatase-like AAA ATPase [Paraferrimonas haliotis]GLS84960.1 ATP-dependent protease [Paraferrimonas haliotis]